jgi:hypothetical protein
MSPMTEDLTELVLNRTWRPQLAITGIDGLPMPVNAACAAALHRRKAQPALAAHVRCDRGRDGSSHIVGEKPALRRAGKV